MKLSIVIPAHNEEGCIRSTTENLAMVLEREEIDYEILIINDNSHDATEDILHEMCCKDSRVRYVNNTPPNGFGLAVRCGLEHFTGDAVAIYMADASDSPDDVVRFYRELQKGYDCVFGTRWSRGGRVYEYPWLKKCLNRFANYFIQIVMQTRYDDVTNAFKLYRRETIQGVQPLLSHHFNITVELPLKAIVRGFSYTIVPNTWSNRQTGRSKFKVKEMGSRYLFIVFYCLIEKWLSRQDYHKAKNRLLLIEEDNTLYGQESL